MSQPKDNAMWGKRNCQSFEMAEGGLDRIGPVDLQRQNCRNVASNSKEYLVVAMLIINFTTLTFS